MNKLQHQIGSEFGLAFPSFCEPNVSNCAHPMLLAYQWAMFSLNPDNIFLGLFKGQVVCSTDCLPCARALWWCYMLHQGHIRVGNISRISLCIAIVIHATQHFRGGQGLCDRRGGL